MSDMSQARKRVESLLDDNSFVELGALVTARTTNFNLNPDETPSDGVVTGYGLIEGGLVYVYSQDADVLNGSVGEMHAKKIANLYDLAMKTGAPVIGLLDSAGLRLQEGTDALAAFGQIYQKASMASGVIPQISAVFGNCGGGLAVLTGLSDFTFMEETAGKLFVNSPNALAGNTIDKCNTSTAVFQATETSNVDVLGTEEEILTKIRELVSMLPLSNEEDISYVECMDDLNRVCTELTSSTDADVVVSALADDKAVFELKSQYGKDVLTGFVRINGVTVGVAANREEALSPAGAEKAAELVNFCDAFEIPVLSVTNATQFAGCECCEKRIAKAAAKLAAAFAEATVPKVNLITGKAFGSVYSIMNSKALGADLTLAWKDAKIGTMDAGIAAKIMYEGQSSDVITEQTALYEGLQNQASSAAARGLVDQLIDAAETRKYVVAAFEVLLSKQDDRPYKKHGTV